MIGVSVKIVSIYSDPDYSGHNFRSQFYAGRDPGRG